MATKYFYELMSALIYIYLSYDHDIFPGNMVKAMVVWYKILNDRFLGTFNDFNDFAYIEIHKE